jgi:hypothetical protein
MNKSLLTVAVLAATLGSFAAIAAIPPSSVALPTTLPASVNGIAATIDRDEIGFPARGSIDGIQVGPVKLIALRTSLLASFPR